jgi:hypothetical protein
MIFMRSGKTGSGKSYHAVLLTYYFWKNGMDVWSNTPLFFTEFNNGQGGENIIDNPEYFTIIERSVLMIGSILRSAGFKTNLGIKRRGKIYYFDTIDEVFHCKDAVILFDEGQTLFRNYDWESVPRMFLQKLEQNRKHELHLITTAQRVKAVNINYRELIQDWSHYETILDLFGFHIYRVKKKDTDFITENMQEQDIPDEKIKTKILTPWTRRLYDTMYDIGFEPLQHYQVNLGDSKVRLHLEAGMSVTNFIQNINKWEKIINLGYGN